MWIARRLSFVRENIKGGKVTDKDFFEAPPGLYDAKVEFVAAAGQVLVQQFRKKTTAIRFFDTVDNPDWVNTARLGVEHACENSDNLIIDVRRNNGGDDSSIEYLYKLLFPEVGSLKEAGKVLVRLRNDNAVLNESIVRQGEATRDLYGPLGFDCFFLDAACITDASNDMFIPGEELDWNTYPSVDEVRGGDLISLSRARPPCDRRV